MLSAAVVAAPCLGAFAALAVADDDREPTLLGRAILASDAYQPGPRLARSPRASMSD